MSWSDFYRRRDAIDAVLHDARHDPSAPLIVDPDVFESLDELLLALRHRWNQRLDGRVAVELIDTDDDYETVVARVTRRLSVEDPTLRAVLDAHVTELARSA
ncbi:hypothetical protein Lesp02_83440 [Lentzea sp. NBRC 105346]|uniref:hypothetical protein n=1 Tax=Lentzea sp. NBRC 105346 TaxID=3032205 RepID=UPI0024A4ACF0|nr:hypothetical protein [Lentzea sp. NBRC 105346]GLZ36157.1 hypothetical protein Lesp02_83440 [Lentzea sp. NBRC 105346]